MSVGIGKSTLSFVRQVSSWTTKIFESLLSTQFLYSNIYSFWGRLSFATIDHINRLIYVLVKWSVVQYGMVTSVGKNWKDCIESRKIGARQRLANYVIKNCSLDYTGRLILSSFSRALLK